MEELIEIQEQAEHVEKNASLLPVSFSASVLAVFVAMATLLGHRAHTEELLFQNKATDTWAEYQAKSIRQSNYETLSAVIPIMQLQNQAKATEVLKQFREKSEKYDRDKEALRDSAKELETERSTEQRKANHFDLGEALLEMGLVITSITLITKRRQFWYFGLLLGAGGLVSVLLGLL